MEETKGPDFPTSNVESTQARSIVLLFCYCIKEMVSSGDVKMSVVCLLLLLFFSPSFFFLILLLFSVIGNWKRRKQSGNDFLT